jgi:hypothetical protein
LPKSVLCLIKLLFLRTTRFSIKLLFLLGIICCQFAQLYARIPVDSLQQKKRYKLTALPIIFYTPETRLGFGASGLFVFNLKKDSIGAQRSSMSLGFAYTLNKQILFTLPYNIFLKNRSYQLYGELAYNKFFYNFYGVGNNQAPDFVEKFGFEFPRIRITALKKVMNHVYVGPRYAFDKYSLFNLDTAAQLYKGIIPGSKGGTVSGFGLVTLYDSRDNIFYPQKGLWGEFVVYRDDERTGSSFNYTRLALDVRKYFTFKENTLALNAYSIYSDADLPFFQMANLGGQHKMRGFYEGRYRDNNLLVFQVEYRRFITELVGFTVFADVGQVSHRYSEFNGKDWRYTYGLGLRLQLDKAQKINLRIDVGVGNKKILPYFTIGEAF